MFFCAVVHFHCIDPSASSADGFSGTDQHTEVTAHTVLGNKNGFARFLIKPNCLIAPLGHIDPQTLKQVVNDAVTILHDRRCDLEAPGPQQQKLHCVTPGLDAAHAAQVGPLQRRVAAQIGQKPQSDGFDRRAGIAANCGAPPHRRGGGVGVQIHIGDALDGVDCRDAAGAALHGRPGGVAQLAQVSSFGRFIAAPVSF